MRINNGNRDITTSTAYTYDVFGRLMSETPSKGAATTYTYDQDSNRQTVQMGKGNPATYTYSQDATDTLLSVSTGQTYTYDSSGDNITGTGHTLSWDNQGALSKVADSGTVYTAYTRDVLGRLHEETTHYGDTSNYVSRYDGASDSPAYETGSFHMGSMVSYLSGPGGLTMTYIGNRTTGIATFSYSDMRGDVVAMAGMSGKFIGTKGPSSYSAFGAQLSGATDPVTDGSYGFLGKDQKETASSVMGMGNIVLMGARPYDPLLGRFLSVDPVVHGSANDYDYVNQDPVNGLDLAGTDCGWLGLGCVFNAVKKAVLDVAAVPPYAQYYAEYQVGTFADNHHIPLVGGLLRPDEERLLLEDEGIDQAKGESVEDEGVYGYMTPWHSWGTPSWTWGPKVWLPGTEGHGRIDLS